MILAIFYVLVQLRISNGMCRSVLAEISKHGVRPTGVLYLGCIESMRITSNLRPMLVGSVLFSGTKAKDVHDG
jgi:hypothetical protein